MQLEFTENLKWFIEPGCSMIRALIWSDMPLILKTFNFKHISGETTRASEREPEQLHQSKQTLLHVLISV